MRESPSGTVLTRCSLQILNLVLNLQAVQLRGGEGQPPPLARPALPEGG